MKQLSKTTLLTLAALASDDRLVVTTLRYPDGDARGADDWHAAVSPRMNMARFTVPIQTFRKMRRDGLLVKACEAEVTSTLIHCEYVLTDAGRAALAAA